MFFLPKQILKFTIYSKLSCSVKFSAINKVYKDYHHAVKRLNRSETFL